MLKFSISLLYHFDLTSQPSSPRLFRSWCSPTALSKYHSHIPRSFVHVDPKCLTRAPLSRRRYLILSSRVVRPGHPYRLSVNVLDNRQPVVVRAALFRDSVRLSGLERECGEDSMNLFEIPVSGQRLCCFDKEYP